MLFWKIYGKTLGGLYGVEGMGHPPSHEFFDPPSKQMPPMGHPPPKIKLPSPLKSDTPPFIEKRSFPPFNEKRRPLPRNDF